MGAIDYVLLKSLAETFTDEFNARVMRSGGEVPDRQSIITQIRELKESGLWDKASLVMIPGARKAGTLFCIKPIVDGDFTFNRNSITYQINKSGILESVPVHVPAFDWDIMSNRYKIRSDPQRTNYYSGSIVLQSVVGIVPTAEMSIKDPEGLYAAYRITNASPNYCVRTSMGTDGQVRSIYARTVSGTGIVSLMAANTLSKSLFTLTEKWQKFELPVNTSDSLGTNFYIADFRNPACNLSEVLVWNPQVEPGSTSTAPIRTPVGQTLTRMADYATKTIPSGIIRIITTIDGIDTIDDAPVPGNTYTLPFGNINRVLMLKE